MAQVQSGDALQYRLFAKLIMFITLLLGLGIGYFAGVEVGEQNALELIQKGRTAEATTVDEQTATAKKSDEASATALAKCYEEGLGKDRYAKWTAGEGLTVEEVFKVLPCESLKE